MLMLVLVVDGAHDGVVVASNAEKLQKRIDVRPYHYFIKHNNKRKKHDVNARKR